MGFFNFGKKKEAACCSTPQETVKKSCCCNGNCDENQENQARFIVLGACCKKSTETFEHVKQAVKELGFNEEVVNIGDPVEIAKYGVLQTPALLIDNRVVSYGKLLTVDEVKQLIRQSGVI